eukprot:g2649.t1
MEDTIHKRLRKLAILLETCQDELATLTNELSDVSIEKNQPSSLTQQFMAMSPSDPSPNPRQYKKRDRKQTPAFVKEVQEVEEGARLKQTPQHLRVPSAQPEKKRIQPTLVPPSDAPGNLELHRGYAIGPDYKKLEQEWHERRQQTLDTQQPLESLAQPKEYREITTDDENEEAEQDLFLPSFQLKAKGYSKENTKQWIQRLYREAILKNINPILKPEGLGFLFVKLGRVKKGFQVTQKEIQDAVKNVLALKQLFKRLIAFIDEPKATNMRM